MSAEHMRKLITLLENGNEDSEPDIEIDGRRPVPGQGKPSPIGKPSPSGGKKIVDQDYLKKKAGQIDWTRIKLRGISPRRHNPNNPGNPIHVLVQAIQQFNYFLANNRPPSGPMMKSMKQVIQDSPRLDELDKKVLKVCFKYLVADDEPGLREHVLVDEDGNLDPTHWQYEERGFQYLTIGQSKSFYCFLKCINYMSEHTNLPYTPSLQAALAEALGKLHGFSLLDDTDEEED